ncbi:MAG: glycosyltransferase [Eubacteriales bacterium]|nr:glycosyltransferase [Eubacteriales bacterium]
MLNLMFCGNDKVFDGMLVSLLSIIKYTKKPLGVYILTMDLSEINESYIPVSERQAVFLEKLIKTVNCESTVKLIDISDIFKKEMTGSINILSSYTPYTMVRLFADEIEDIPDKILYLDTDTIASDSIEPVFDTDMEGAEFAGVIDYLGKWFIRYDYMNAGVMLLNMPQIRKTGVFKRARQMCGSKKMWFPDQTALNRCVKKKKFIDTRYNEQRRLHKDTCIRHFCKTLRLFPYFHTINIKPWQIDKLHEVFKIYIYDDILNEYTRQKRIYEEMG